MWLIEVMVRVVFAPSTLRSLMERTVCLVTGAEDLIGISTIIKNPLSFSKIIECTLRGQSIVMN